METTSIGGTSKTFYCDILPRRHLTLVLILITLGALAFLSDIYSNSNIFTILIPNGFSGTDSTYNLNSVIFTEMFNKTDAQCVPTLYVDCGSYTNNVSTTNETYGIVMLRRPSWITDTNFNFSHCQYSKCVFQDEVTDSSVRLVIVYIVGLNDDFLPPQRWPDQLYAAATWESPHHTHASFLSDKNSVWNRAFNITATYRTESEIFVPYGKLSYKIVKQTPNYYEIASSKEKWVAWFVSNCRTPSRRDEYVQQMKEIIDVDIYGGCGQPCSQNVPLCSDDIPMKYRFYLSFENSLCTDYITEKFFKLFQPNTHIIPVVRGELDYDQYLPNTTFINAANFKTAADLARFLKQLGENTVVYSRYLAHKDMYTYKKHSGIEDIGCQACKYLHTNKEQQNVYDMKQWMGDNQCHDPEDL